MNYKHNQNTVLVRQLLASKVTNSTRTKSQWNDRDTLLSVDAQLMFQATKKQHKIWWIWCTSTNKSV